MTSGHAIVIEGFTRRFGRRIAVDDVSLQVPRGSIFGLLGRNGAGKSTTIRALMNLISPSAGRMTLLDLDSVKDALRIGQRVAYVPEEPKYYDWMTVDEILSFNASFYESWDVAHAASLVSRLEVPRGRRLRELSLGTRAKVGLVMALGARPELLILDDPTSGLDAVVRREFLETIIANVQSEGGTVFFSSHLIHEMERVADRVAIMDRGRVVACAPLDRLKAETKKLRAVYPEAPPDRFTLPGLIRVEREPHQAVLTLSGCGPAMMQQVRGTGAESVEVLDMSLEEIFIETVTGGGVHVHDDD
jgi:ABC-2 type transport system ATP-binding protein